MQKAPESESWKLSSCTAEQSWDEINGILSSMESSGGNLGNGVVWAKSFHKAGGAWPDTTSGVKNGLHLIAAYDSGTTGQGAIQLYKTSGNSKATYTAGDQVATMKDVEDAVDGIAELLDYVSGEEI